jgi:hypothetical protein
MISLTLFSGYCLYRSMMVSRCLAHSLGDGPCSVRDFRSGLALRSDSGAAGGTGPDAVDIVAARFSGEPKHKPEVMGRAVDRISLERSERQVRSAESSARMQGMQGRTLLKTARQACDAHELGPNPYKQFVQKAVAWPAAQ